MVSGAVEKLFEALKNIVSQNKYKIGTNCMEEFLFGFLWIENN